MCGVIAVPPSGEQAYSLELRQEQGAAQALVNASGKFGKYEIKSLLGKGASGSVYLAVDTFSSAEVALKVIDPAVFEDAEFGAVLRAQFLNEASLAGKLNHPHIVAILDAVVTDDAGHIAMEYVPGGNLDRYTGEKSLLAVEDVIEVAFKCCGALDYAFREGIIHRDIKPANIMAARGTEVKIADFGAAYLHRTSAASTANIGTPAYMSPEQLEEKPLTHHSDMYCLGVVLYQLLTGKRPFAAQSIAALVQKILTEEPPRPGTLRADLPAELDAVVLKALQKNPADRYPSWADFALELAKVGRLSAREHAILDSEKYAALKRVEMFGGLNEPDVWEMVHAGTWKRLDARSTLVRENDSGDSFFFLAKGEAKVTRHGRLLNVMQAGECFGEMSYIRRGALPRQATVESMTEVIVAEFDSAALQRTSLACQLNLMRALISNLVDRLLLADARIAGPQAS